MRTITLTIEYDGTNYCGWQQQHNGVSIQATVKRAIETMTNEKITLVGASRTDAGVHALAQVAHFKTRTRISGEGFVRGLNSLLPGDIRVHAAEDAADSFHALYDARGKTYRYLINTEPVASAIHHHRAWHVGQSVNTAAMRRVAAVLVGTHDFSAFKASGSHVKHAVRTISALTVKRMKRGRPFACIVIEVTGDGFVRHMVRNVVGTLVDIGVGRLPEEAMKGILASRRRAKAGVCAPACGLYLVRVFY